MRTISQSKLLVGTWGPPVVGLAGTITAVLTAFALIDSEPKWKMALASAGASLVVVGIGLLLL